MLGQYDFFSQTIEINNEIYNFDAAQVTRIIHSAEPLKLTGSAHKLYKTYLHELVHFYDSNATLWGMEFTARMQRYYNNPTSEQVLEVFKLNDAEIDLHKYLATDVKKQHNLDFDQIVYCLEYNENIGVHVKFHYRKHIGGQLQSFHSVPLSMLALLEGHAYSQEQLFSFQSYEAQNDYVATSLLKQEVENLIQDAGSTEYTCLLALIFQLFPNLPFQNKLETLIVLSKLVLNAPTIMISGTPQYILNKIFRLANPILVSAIQQDLSRGMNRSTLLLVFIMILGYHDDVIGLPLGNNFKDEIEQIIIKYYLADLGPKEVKNSLFTFWELEYEANCNYLFKSGAELTHSVATEMKDKPWYSLDLSTIKKPQFFLSNCDVITPPNSFDFKIETHFEDTIERSTELASRLRNTVPEKQHQHPLISYDVLSRVRNGETGIRYYPEF